MRLKYETPRVYLIDIDTGIENALIEDGFNVKSGTFGVKYRVSKNDECALNGNLNYLTESDIVFVNLQESGLYGNNPLQDKQWLPGDRIAYDSSGSGEFFYPQNIYSALHKEKFQKMFSNGSVIVVFSGRERLGNYYHRKIKGGVRVDSFDIEVSNYEWIPGKKLRVSNCEKSKRIQCPEKPLGFSKFFSKFEEEIEFNVTFNEFGSDDLLILCTNTLRETVGFIKVFQNEENSSFLIMLPQFQNLYPVIEYMLKNILPLIVPELLPDFAKSSWTDDADYIIPVVQSIVDEKRIIEGDYKEKIKVIEERISEEKSKYQFLTNLLTADATGEFLVENVIKTLKYVGFENVINGDDETNGNRQEDIRIHLDDKLIVGEVKGINGNPSEDDCQTILKYISRNKQKVISENVHGVLIVNHQKLKPPLDRAYPAFTKEQIEDSINCGYTLVSTWELYRSVRLYQEGLIESSELLSNLQTPGLFTAIPQTWKYLGKIENRVKGNTVACTTLSVEKIKVGDEIFIDNSNSFGRIPLEEIMIGGKFVTEAREGDQCGINAKMPLKNTSKLYLIC